MEMNLISHEEKRVTSVEEEQDKEEIKQVIESFIRGSEEDKEVEDEKEGDEEEKEDGEEESGLPSEELNKRVEEFIARVNKQCVI